MNDVDYGSATATFENKSGYHVGVYLDLDLGPLGVRPGLRYLKVGPIYEGLAEAQEQGLAQESLYDSFDVRFFALPIDAVFALPFPMLSPYVFVGPEFRSQSAPDAPEVLERALNKWSYIGNIGVGAKISLPGVGITLTPEIRYSFGLSNLIDREFVFANQTFATTEQRRSESFFISVGIEP
jgi:hypothetical protein